jgi:hypothetical protein
MTLYYLLRQKQAQEYAANPGLYEQRTGSYGGGLKEGYGQLASGATFKISEASPAVQDYYANLPAGSSKIMPTSYTTVKQEEPPQTEPVSPIPVQSGQLRQSLLANVGLQVLQPAPSMARNAPYYSLETPKGTAFLSPGVASKLYGETNRMKSISYSQQGYMQTPETNPNPRSILPAYKPSTISGTVNKAESMQLSTKYTEDIFGSGLALLGNIQRQTPTSNNLKSTALNIGIGALRQAKEYKEKPYELVGLYAEAQLFGMGGKALQGMGKVGKGITTGLGLGYQVSTGIAAQKNPTALGGELVNLAGFVGAGYIGQTLPKGDFRLSVTSESKGGYQLEERSNAKSFAQDVLGSTRVKVKRGTELVSQFDLETRGYQQTEGKGIGTVTKTKIRQRDYTTDLLFDKPRLVRDITYTAKTVASTRLTKQGAEGVFMVQITKPGTTPVLLMGEQNIRFNKLESGTIFERDISYKDISKTGIKVSNLEERNVDMLKDVYKQAEGVPKVDKSIGMFRELYTNPRVIPTKESVKMYGFGEFGVGVKTTTEPQSFKETLIRGFEQDLSKMGRSGLVSAPKSKAKTIYGYDELTGKFKKVSPNYMLEGASKEVKARDEPYQKSILMQKSDTRIKELRSVSQAPTLDKLMPKLVQTPKATSVMILNPFTTSEFGSISSVSTKGGQLNKLMQPTPQSEKFGQVLSQVPVSVTSLKLSSLLKPASVESLKISQPQSLRTNQGESLKLIQPQVLRTGQIQSMGVGITVPIGFVPPPPPPPPPFFVGGNLYLFPEGKPSRRGRKRKRKYGYAKSLEPMILGITGKRPSKIMAESGLFTRY